VLGSGTGGAAMLTEPIISGMNILSLAGFVLMGIGLTFTRQGRVRAPVAYALMGVGTALVFAGLYLAPASAP
jgi:hypothetical protein